MRTLVLLRHGESEWNSKGLFTGWVDVGLSGAGAQEAVNGGKLLARSGLKPSVVHTSVLTRAIQTANLALEEAGLLGCFTTVRGADTAALRMPSPLLIEQAARALGTRPERMLMIGGSASARQAACAAGCRAAWAGWGYGLLGSEPVGPVWRLERPADLLVRMGPPRALGH